MAAKTATRLQVVPMKLNHLPPHQMKQEYLLEEQLLISNIDFNREKHTRAYTHKSPTCMHKHTACPHACAQIKEIHDISDPIAR